ncbi:transglycosylase SLT domain-containing protein [Pseudobacteriovorax antillogorgiicola]|uniref:transglycosylase SLT domain-containing protein n=1 Tax=Pseudobacteriovorax antillogorgiicola TaxID=1513793 RepID=UPI0013562E7E|nr:transglycosylase SLT domain-containing protein [Pseudobacteriovorax antillogorgiicola]
MAVWIVVVSTGGLEGNSASADTINTYRKLLLDYRQHAQQISQGMSLLRQSSQDPWHKAQIHYFTGAYASAYKTLAAVDDKNLPLSDYIFFLEMRFRLQLELGHKRKIRNQISRRTRASKYLHFLEETDIFYRVKEQISSRYPKVWQSYARKALSDYPYTGASLASFAHFQESYKAGSIPYRVARKLSRLGRRAPNIRDWLHDKVLSNQVSFRGQRRSSHYLKVRLLFYMKDNLRLIDLAKNKLERKLRVKDTADIAEMLARAYEARQDLDQARSTYESYLERLGRNSATMRLWASYGRFLARRGFLDQASDELSKASKKTYSRSIRWSAFWSNYRARNLDKAKTMIQSRRYRSLDRHVPEMRDYWRARVLEKSGDTPGALALDRKILDRWGNGFYATLVMQKYLGQLKPGDYTAGRGKVIPISMKTKGRDVFDVRRWYEEQSKPRPEKRSKLRSVTSLYTDIQENPEYWQLKYPQPFQDWAQAVEDFWALDPLLLYSVMRAESFYNPSAKSPVGARGLMQIMPYTGFNISQDLGDPQFQVTQLTDPAINILYGGYYLAKLLKHYKGNVFYAVASYNAGPLKVDEWLNTCQVCETDEFVDSIPFRETRNYVKKVVANYAMYSRIYRGQLIPNLVDQQSKLHNGFENRLY